MHQNEPQYAHYCRNRLSDQLFVPSKDDSRIAYSAISATDILSRHYGVQRYSNTRLRPSGIRWIAGNNVVHRILRAHEAEDEFSKRREFLFVFYAVIFSENTISIARSRRWEFNVLFIVSLRLTNAWVINARIGYTSIWYRDVFRNARFCLITNFSTLTLCMYFIEIIRQSA